MLSSVILLSPNKKNVFIERKKLHCSLLHLCQKKNERRIKKNLTLCIGLSIPPISEKPCLSRMCRLSAMTCYINDSFDILLFPSLFDFMLILWLWDYFQNQTGEIYSRRGKQQQQQRRQPESNRMLEVVTWYRNLSARVCFYDIKSLDKNRNKHTQTVRKIILDCRSSNFIYDNRATHCPNAR